MKTFSTTPDFVKKTQQNTKKKAFKVAQRRAAETKGVNSARKVHGPVPTIELFQKEQCPFSHAVRNKLTRLGLDFVAHNVTDGNPLKHEQLIQAGGKDQVPFLIDHTSGVKLYETQAIISYLDNTYGSPRVTMFGRIANSIDSKVRARADQIAWTLKTPLHRANEIRTDVQTAVQTVRGSLDFLRSRIEQALRTAEKAQSTGAAASRPKPRKSAAVRANVASLTEAA